MKKKIALLHKLLEFINIFYQKCSTDRGELHQIEWERGDDAPSVLGEVEIITDHHVGCIRSCLLQGLRNKEETIFELESLSIFDSETLVEFIIDQSQRYEEFFSYMQSVENLRTTAIKILKN